MTDVDFRKWGAIEGCFWWAAHLIELKLKSNDLITE